MTLIAPARARNRHFEETDVLPFIKSPKAENPVELKSLAIKISVNGIYAETTQEMHFYNPNNRIFSGELVFPLPDNAVVSGYGPEEYVLRKAVVGGYKIKAHYYGSHQQTICGPCTVTVNIFTNYGRPDEGKRVLTIRLEESGDDIMVGEITIGDKNRGRNNLSGANLSIEAFCKIKAGMNMPEVIGLVGRPNQMNHNEGNGTLMLEYILEDDVKIRVDMKYVVIGVISIMDGAVIDIL